MNLEQLKNDIEALLLYNWEAELQDYCDGGKEERENHIFCVMVRLDNFIFNGIAKPEDYL